MEMTRVHDIVILHPAGEIGFLELNHIESAINSLRKINLSKILLDMTSVNHVHYLIFRRLAENAMHLRSENGDLKLACVNPETKEIIRFTGADHFLEDHRALSECILSFLKPIAGADAAVTYQ